MADDSTLTAVQVRAAILNNVDSVSGLSSYCVTGGRLNAYKALQSIHNFTYRYQSINGLTHYSYCSCGPRITQNHTYSVSGTTRTCTKCGYVFQMNKVDPEYETE